MHLLTLKLIQKPKILDIGSVKDNGASFHKTSVSEFIFFLRGTKYVPCGHNIFKHDIKYVGEAINEAGIKTTNIIDTLFLSPLLFPTKPYHSLLKDDKLQVEGINNPLNDSIKARDLLNDEIVAFKQSDDSLKQIFYGLLKDRKEFQSFFWFIKYESPIFDIESLIRNKFKNEICEQVDLAKIISERPIELAYCLSLINSFIQYKNTFYYPTMGIKKTIPK